MLTPFHDRLARKRVILGSSSAQRQKILKENLGMQFEIIKSDFEEDLDKENFTNTEDYVMATCKGKFDDIMASKLKFGADSEEKDPHLVICADTVVALRADGEQKEHIFEKARNRDHAVAMIRQLSGRKHRIVTAVIFKLNNESEACSFVESTEVEFVDIPDIAVEAYVDSGEAFGKAGAYGIQGLGSSFVKGIKGDYYNAVGFPSNRFAMELSRKL